MGKMPGHTFGAKLIPGASSGKKDSPKVNLARGQSQEVSQGELPGGGGASVSRVVKV